VTQKQRLFDLFVFISFLVLVGIVIYVLFAHGFSQSPAEGNGWQPSVSKFKDIGW